MKRKSLTKILLSLCCAIMLFAGARFALPQQTEHVYAEGTEETWVFNDTVDISEDAEYEICFTTIDDEYECLRIISNYQMMYNYTAAYEIDYETSQMVWNLPKTITLSESATGDLLTFLNANATKQQGGGTTPSTGVYFDNTAMFISGSVMIVGIIAMAVLISKKQKFI